MSLAKTPSPTDEFEVDTNRFDQLLEDFERDYPAKRETLHEDFENVLRRAIDAVGHTDRAGPETKPSTPRPKNRDRTVSEGRNYIVGGRNKLHEIRTGRRRRTTKEGSGDHKHSLAYWIIETVFYHFGVDVSVERVLNGRAVHRTDMVKPRGLTLRRYGNRPDDDGREAFTVHVEQLNLSGWDVEVLDTSGKAVDRLQTWLHRVWIDLDAAMPENPLTALTAIQVTGAESEREFPRGWVEAYDLRHVPEEEREGLWTLTAARGDGLVPGGVISKLHLCAVRLAAGESVVLSCSASAGDLRADFKGLKGTELETHHATRAQVFAQVLRKRTVSELTQEDIEANAGDQQGTGGQPELVTLSRLAAGSPPK